MSKMTKCKKFDRISDLPESLLEHILSFLPIKEVVQACVLSKRWKHLWCSLPYLHFDIHEHKPGRFEDFVDSVIISRNCSQIQQLRLYSLQLRHSRVNLWIGYAIRHNLQVLDLIFSDDSLQLTPRIFCCGSLRVLKLNFYCGRNYTIDPSTSICLPFLETMHLKYIKFLNDGVFESLLSTSKVLESLAIEWCDFEGIELLHIFAPQLRNLILRCHLQCQTIFSTPRLTSLNILGGVLWDLAFMGDLISLVDAIIGASIPEYCSNCLIELIRVIQNVKNLTFCSPFLESTKNSLSEVIQTEECTKVPFWNLKWLKMQTNFSAGEVQAINTLLQYSRNLETLALENTSTRKRRPFEEAKTWMHCTLPHLKSVRIQNSQLCWNPYGFIKFLVQNAAILKKLVILPTVGGEKILVDESKITSFSLRLLIILGQQGNLELRFM